MEKFGHVANKIRAFKVVKFRFSSAVNQSFWSSHTTTPQRHNIVEVYLRFAHSTSSISFNACFYVCRNSARTSLWYNNTCFYVSCNSPFSGCSTLFIRQVGIPQYNCNIPNIRLDETLGMRLYSIFSFPKCSKTSVYC